MAVVIVGAQQRSWAHHGASQGIVPERLKGCGSARTGSNTNRTARTSPIHD